MQYQVYDVTNFLKNGENVVDATLGDGWFRGHLAGWIKDNRNFYGGKLALLMQLNIEFDDNTTETIITDSSWKSSTGSILCSDIYNGETYNARLEKIDWNFFRKVEVLNHPKPERPVRLERPVRDDNTDLKGNIRDFATLEPLVVLSNLESYNSELIKQNIPAEKRLKQLNKIAIEQMKILINNKSIKKLI